MAEQIEAAGVVLVRPGDDGAEVAVVHRPHRSDWSLPKGKLEAGEHPEVAAVREVLEETGVHCALGPSLGERRYEVEGVPKRVRYWRATVLEQHERASDDEVDEVLWMRRKAAKALLTYADDRILVDAALALPETVPILVLRHAQAMKRVAWRESEDPLGDDDAARPLDEHGVAQALALVDRLAAYGLRRIVSSDARRCRATVEAFADGAGLDLQLEHALSEEGCEHDPDETRATVERLVNFLGPDLWCSHRPVLPLVTQSLRRSLGLARSDDRLDPRLAPGAGLVLHRDLTDGSLVVVDRFAP